MELFKFLNLNRGDLVSIVGAGGKTTLMYTLAQELREEHKILVTTTTKIFLPDREQYDYMEIGFDNFEKIRYCNKKGIYVYGKFVSEDGKLIGINTDTLDKELSFFDYTIVEADGSKGKPIKGWNSTEPVVSSKTRKTIGVLSIESIGKAINEENVHRVSEFINITNAVEKEPISMKNILSIIFHRNGLFKDSVGERILFINKVENNEEIVLVDELVHYIKLQNERDKLIDKIVYGSLRNKEYYRVKSEE